MVVTFVVSGAIHDAAVMLVTRSISFLIVPWFTALGLIVLLTSWLGLDNRRRAWAIRATINTLLVLSGLEVSLLAKRMFAFP